MELTQLSKEEIIKQYGKNEKDTGHAACQIVLLTKEILQLSQHFRQHLKDHAGRRGLLKKVSQRKSLIQHYYKKDPEACLRLLEQLEIRKGNL